MCSLVNRLFLPILVARCKRPVLYSLWVDKVSLGLGLPFGRMSHWGSQRRNLSSSRFQNRCKANADLEFGDVPRRVALVFESS